MYQGGCIPLLLAAKYAHLPTVEYLLEKGANPNAQDNVNDQLNINHLFVTVAWHRRKDRMYCTWFVDLIQMVDPPNFTKRWRLLQRCSSMAQEQWCPARTGYEPLFCDVVQPWVNEIMVYRMARQRCKHLPRSTLEVTNLRRWKQFSRLNSLLLWEWGILLKWGTWSSAKEGMSTWEIM